MNTNQNTTFTNQDAFKKWRESPEGIEANSWSCTMSYTASENFNAGFQAATKASEIEINSLKERVEELSELLKDRQSDLDFEFNRAEQNELDFNSLKERVAELEADLELLKPHPKCDMGCMLVCNMEGNAITELQADNNQLREALESAIECTDDYNMIDRMDGKQYFKHEVFKHEIKLLEELRVTPTQSLAEHDNATIERIATALENAEGEFKTLPEYVALVRGMKHE